MRCDLLFFCYISPLTSSCFFFFFNDPATPEISPLPHHAALPIFLVLRPGPAVNAQDRRVTLSGHEVGRLHDEAVDRRAVAALEADRLHGAEPDPREPRVVLARQRPQRRAV